VGYKPPGTQNLSDRNAVVVDKTTVPPGQQLPGQAPAAPAQDKGAALMQKYGGKPDDGKDWAYLASLPEAAQVKIIGLSNHDINPNTYSTRIATGAGISPRDAAITATSRFDRTYNQQDYPNIQASRLEFDKGKLGNTTRSLNVFVQHADVAGQLVQALQNGDSQLVNRARNMFQEAFGYTAPGNLQAATTVLASELGKAIQGTEVTQGDRERLMAGLSNVRSPEQIMGVLNTYKTLAGGQLLGLEKQYQASTRRNDYRERYLFPQTIKALGVGDGAAPGPGSSPADPLSQAKDAIARGAPRDAVIQRLRQNGVDPTGL
jgi:hypothetical protein